eukprot:1020636-Pyramimonas_sp.AAC.1
MPARPSPAQGTPGSSGAGYPEKSRSVSTLASQPRPRTALATGGGGGARPRTAAGVRWSVDGPASGESLPAVRPSTAGVVGR